MKKTGNDHSTIIDNLMKIAQNKPLAKGTFSYIDGDQRKWNVTYQYNPALPEPTIYDSVMLVNASLVDKPEPRVSYNSWEVDEDGVPLDRDRFSVQADLMLEDEEVREEAIDDLRVHFDPPTPQPKPVSL